MLNYLRLVAGVFVGAGALLLLWRGENTAGVALLSAMLGFFVGEYNGKAASQENPETS